MNKMKHIASCSFGKDSIATVILAHINNEPIDLINENQITPPTVARYILSFKKKEQENVRGE